MVLGIVALIPAVILLAPASLSGWDESPVRSLSRSRSLCVNSLVTGLALPRHWPPSPPV